MKGPCRALFYQGSSEISHTGSIMGSILGSMKVQEGPLSLGRVGQQGKRGKRMLKIENPEIFSKNLLWGRGGASIIGTLFHIQSFLLFPPLTEYLCLHEEIHRNKSNYPLPAWVKPQITT